MAQDAVAKERTNQKRSLETQKKILDAAEELFAEFGFARPPPFSILPHAKTQNAAGSSRILQKSTFYYKYNFYKCSITKLIFCKEIGLPDLIWLLTIWAPLISCFGKLKEQI